MKKFLLFLLVYVFSQDVSAQERMLTGVLEDNGEPLIFATAAIYRNDILIRGAETDLDGAYAILCMVGDKIEFSYIGYTPKSTIVTEEMLSGPNSAPRHKIKRITSKAFRQKMMERKRKLSEIIKNDSTGSIIIASLPNKYLLNNYIDDFSIINGKVEIKKPKPYIRYDLSITQNIGLRKVAPWHMYKLQSIYSQGRPVNGQLKFRDHTTGESHSFGPKLSELSNTGVKSYDNNLFNSSVTLGTKVIFEAERNDQKIYSIVNHNKSTDIFNKHASNKTDIRLGFIKFDPLKNNNFWNVDLNINRTAIGNHNYNGYYQKTLQAMMVQSPSFNSKNASIENNESYSPEFNNPRWYLNNNSTPVLSDAISLIINQKWTSNNKKSEISNSLHLENKKTRISEIINTSSLGKEGEISSMFNAKTQTAFLVTNLKKKRFGSNSITLELYNIASISKTDFTEEKNNEVIYNLSNKLIRNVCTSRVVYQTATLKSSVSLNALLATNQPSNLFNPEVNVSYDFNFRKKKIDKLRPFAGVKRITKEQDLLLDRYNYSSFLIDHYQLQSLNQDVPLWLPEGLKNEIKDEYEIGVIAAKRYSKSTLRTRLEYKYIDQRNVIFPEFENGNFVLRNSADFITHQISWTNTWQGNKYIWGKNIGFDNSFEISHFRTNVSKLHNSSDRIPIAGFADISKNLIGGQPVGVIVGSDYNRTANGEIIIEQNGFPTKAQDLKVIADPTPLLNFKYDLVLYLNRFSLKILLDGQVGGKVWNGTQQTLDYYGVSQNSAEQREIDNYIFEGVNSNGSKNTTQVALADPQNGLEGYQWTRYGINGIASSYIRNASHISLKSLELSYTQNRYNQNDIKLTIYAKNILTLASFRGFTTSHLYEDRLSYGLQYFNQPIVSEIGTSITINF